MEGTNIHIQGAWNQAILNPEWLVKHVPSLSEPSEQPVVEMMLFPFRIRVAIEDVFIKPSQEFLVIEPRNSAPDIFERISKIGEEIYEQLQHTPITAIGHNFAFTLDAEESFIFNHTSQDEFFKDSLPDDLSASLESDTASQLRYSLNFTDKQYTLNVTFESEADGTRRLHLNFHHDLPSRTPKEVNEFLTSFVENYATVDNLKNTMIKTS